MNLNIYHTFANAREITDPLVLNKLNGWLSEFQKNFKTIPIDGFYQFNSKKTFGVCSYSSVFNVSAIEINVVLLKDLNDEQLKNTFIHELCHATEYAYYDNHGPKWKYIAEKASSIFDTNITRLCNTSKLNPNIISALNRDSEIKYEVYCSGCDKIIARYRSRSKSIRNIANCRCRRCGNTNLKVIRVHLNYL
jgi:predicted SprT family Zn-dependent metalloprotease